ncbi:hypothetical protein ACQKEK_02485 [Pseudomonas sp. NPDC077408]|uniref:hypothetical protein n=1 Tax=Streptomyces parvus TaxID=66428 RepID=UPI0037219E4E
MSDLIGSPKQVKWAESIIVEAKASIERAAQAAPQFKTACIALSFALDEITDAAWIISSRNNLGLSVGAVYGTGEPTVGPMSIRDHQLLRNEHWRNPALRKGRSSVSSQTADSIKQLFAEAQRSQLA